MREIKFRIWNKSHNDMCSWEDLIFAKQESVFAWLNMQDGDNNIIMQFTGLHDKNGKEIYEGDIVIVGCEYHKVKYCERTASFYMLNPNGQSLDFDDYDIYIIGNIHENPELIK